MKLIKENFEEGYHENPLYREARDSQRNRARLTLVRRYCAGGRLLEIGCGAGGFLRAARGAYDIEGMDISRSAVEGIRAEFGERVRVGNLEADALPEGPYDVIVAFNILEHLRQPAAAAEKICAALAPGGLLVGSAPLNAGLVGRVVTRIGNYFDRTHVSTLPPEGWQQVFRAAGFRSSEFFGEVTFGRNRCAYLRGPLWRQLAFNLMFACVK